MVLDDDMGLEDPGETPDPSSVGQTGQEAADPSCGVSVERSKGGKDPKAAKAPTPLKPCTLCEKEQCVSKTCQFCIECKRAEACSKAARGSWDV